MDFVHQWTWATDVGHMFLADEYDLCESWEWFDFENPRSLFCVPDLARESYP